MSVHLWLGDEAIAQAAIDAGISGVYAYPGTPSTEITEYIQQSPEAIARRVRSQWSCNEKTAMEAALGMSFAGKRAMVCMKHVGVNVAADPFINSAITGAHGGLVLAVADDPSMHSSQNEQDSRFYGQFALVPIFEPSSQQEAYDMVLEAFDVSERHAVPVMVRITTRLAHSRADVTRRVEKPRDQNALRLHHDPQRYVLLPAIARRNYAELLGKTAKFVEEAERSPFNAYEDGADRRLGIVACGIAVNYLNEVFGEERCPYPVLKIGRYPMPRRAIAKLMEQCESVLVLEDGYPFVEDLMRGVGFGPGRVRGRLDGTLPRAGELDPNVVGRALESHYVPGADVPHEVVPRPPSMCPGCSHMDVFEFLQEAIKDTPTARVFSDIGCYTLGALPPYEAINTCVDMGASIPMAKGAAEAGVRPAIAVIGDSTFTHSGMTGLLDVVEDKAPVTVIISDNLTTGMTGGQQSPASGRLEYIVAGIGVDPAHIHLLNPLPSKHAENVEVMRKELAYEGPSVIIARRPCVRIKLKKDV
ncbi:MAG: 2-oxoacid ferredoxin oxidoreductase [Verrucomicrobia bacterium ADurb.Bin345]|nr:MAG: 2-oxoacid ferredoxin oxidoreductase [Verrucomicrobia bacterium ADurb.Bin345]